MRNFYNCIFESPCSHEDMMNVIHETGYFSLLVSACFLISFLLMLCKVSREHKKILRNSISIVKWFAIGMILIHVSNIFVLYFVIVSVLLLSICVLRGQHVLTNLIDTISQNITNNMVQDKIIKNYLDKSKNQTGDLVFSSFLNDRILWFIIFYKFFVAMAALFY